MKFTLNKLVAAVVLSVTAMSANAEIEANNGNSEFAFSAWDADAGIGYTYDLNWNKYLNDFVGIDQPANATGNAALFAGAKVQSSLIGAGGVIFDDVLTGFGGAGFTNLANVQWNLAAFDSTGRTRLLVTQGDAGLPFTPTQVQGKAAVTGAFGYAAAADSFMTDLSFGVGTDSYAYTIAANGSAYAGNLGSGYDNNLADTTNVLGGTSNLFFLGQTTQANTAAPSFVQQLTSVDGNAIVAKTYLQDGVWRLNISAVTVAAVPEPETYGMLLAGLGLIGAIARRRNKTA